MAEPEATNAGGMEEEIRYPAGEPEPGSALGTLPNAGAPVECGPTPSAGGHESPGWTTRRQFLSLAALATLGLVVEGCGQKASFVTTSTTALSAALLGPEPRVSPAPTQTPPPSPTGTVSTVTADVCVVGGGAAGMMAAIAAARQGAKTILVEDSYVLGGNLTRGLVNFDRAGWGSGVMVGGLFEELVRGLAAQGDGVFPSAQTAYTVPCDPDALRQAALQMTRQAGVTVRLGTSAMWAFTSGRQLDSIWVRERATLSEIAASIFIDCTGDGNLGFLAGHPYWFGQRTTGNIQGQTLIFCAGPVNLSDLWDFAQKEGSTVEDYCIVGMHSIMREVRASKDVVGSPQLGMLINRNMWRNMVSISASETLRQLSRWGRFLRHLQHSGTAEHTDPQGPGGARPRVSGLAHHAPGRKTVLARRQTVGGHVSTHRCRRKQQRETERFDRSRLLSHRPSRLLGSFADHVPKARGLVRHPLPLPGRERT